MSVYLIIDLEVTDPEGYAEYVEKVPAVIKKYGGKYVIRGGKITPLAGDWNPERIVVLEFPSQEHVNKWALSPEQMPLAELRRKSTNARTIMVEGCPPDGGDG